ncbi:formate C-acetyltransferase [bacterium]|nr:formate C-acetyltransferase [bacterium]
MKNKTWRNFKGQNWRKDINVRDFIQNNYTPYKGDSSFLEGPTQRTQNLSQKLIKLLELEKKRDGVLSIDTKTVSSLLTYKPGYIDKKNEIIVGLQTEKPLERGVNPFGGIRLVRKSCEAYGYKLHKKIEEYFHFRTTHNDGVFRVYTDEIKKARNSGVITGLPDAYGRGRIIGDYRRVALYGVDFLIEKKQADKVILGKKPMSEENIKLCEELYRQIDFLDQLKKMAKMYGLNVSKPASNSIEATQWLYFAYLGAIKEQNGAAISLGRVSTFLDIYFQRDLKEGVLTEKGVQEIIDAFVLKLRMARELRTTEYNELFAGDPLWVTESLGGMGTNSRTLVTKSSFRFLNTLYNLGSSPEPNLTVLWSKKLPLKFKQFCAKVSIDTNSIQYENDDLMRPLYGDDYGISCCVSAMKIGKQSQFFGARCNLPKVLLMALNGGRDEKDGKQIGPETLIYKTKKLDYKEVLKRYNFYQKWLCKLYVNTMNIIHFMHDKYAYEKLQMALHDTNVERFMAFGIAGLSVIADSLSAIKYAEVKPIYGKNGLITDFKINGDFPKYGNDDDRVDNIAQKIVTDFYNNLKKTHAYRNAKHTLSILTITSNVVYGKKTGATPDGRKKGEPFAPGANPMHERDSTGALASLNSVAKIPYKCCRDGISNTFSVMPSVIGKEEQEQIDNLTTMLDGYFTKRGHHLNVNVLNREQLIDAMKYPYKYPNLTIRVSGYAVNFHKLSREQQKEVISRTFHRSI